MPKYLARPPTTPAIMRFDRDRRNGPLIPGTCRLLRTLGCCLPGGAQPRAAFFCRGLIFSFGGPHFECFRPGRPPYRGSGTVSAPCFRLRARLVTPRSGSWRASFCAPLNARLVGVLPRPFFRSARVFGIWFSCSGEWFWARAHPLPTRRRLGCAACCE